MFHQPKVELQEIIERERERERERENVRNNNKFIEIRWEKRVKRYSNTHQIIIVMLCNRITLYSYILSLQCNKITSIKSNKRKKDNNLKIEN